MLKDGEFGACLNVEGVGYVYLEPKKSLPAVKSKVGKIFHSPIVKSVCAFDKQGIARLYLKKTPFGVVREER